VKRPLLSGARRVSARGPVGATAGSLGSAVGAQLALLVSGVLVARMLGVEDRGHFALLTLFPVVLALFGALGLPVATTYSIARGQSAAAVLFSLRAVIAAQCVVLTFCHFVILSFVLRNGPAYVKEAGAVTLAIVPAYVGQAYALSTLQGMRRFRAFNLVRLLPAGVYATGAVALYLVQPHSLLRVTVMWTIAVVVVALLIGLVAFAGVEWSKYGEETQARFDLLKFGLKSLLGSTSPVENFRLDQAVIGLFLSPISLGLYVVGMAFTNLPRFIGQSIGVVAYPHLASSADERTRRRALIRFVMGGAALSAATVVTLEVTTSWLVPLFFGSEFRAAIAVTHLLLISAFFASMRRLLTDCAQGAGIPGVGSVAEVASWIVLLPAIALLAPRYGIRGVAVAMIVAYATSSGALLFQLVRPRAARWRFSHRLSAATLGLSTLGVVVSILSGAALALSTPLRPTLLIACLLGLSGAGFIAARFSPRTVASVLIVFGALTLAFTGVRLTSWMTLSDGAFFAAAAVLLLELLWRRRVPALPSWQVAGLLLLTAGAIVGSAYASNVYASVTNFTKLFVSSALLILLFAAWKATMDELLSVAWAWVVSCTASATWALVHLSSAERSAGLATHPNSLALTCVLGLGPALVLGRQSASWRRVLAVSASAVLTLGVITSGSRAGLLGAASVALAMWIIVCRRRLRMLVVALGAIAVYIASGIQVSLPASNALARLWHPATSGVAESDAGHRIALADSLNALAHHPLSGVGFENAKGALDVYVQVWSSGGVLALVGFGLIAINALAPLWMMARTRWVRHIAETVPAAVGISLGFAGYLVAAAFQNALWERYVWLAPALVAACWPHFQPVFSRGQARHAASPGAASSIAGLAGEGQA
jgi:O-antigen/teichoic acid export membrane protein